MKGLDELLKSATKLKDVRDKMHLARLVWARALTLRVKGDAGPESRAVGALLGLGLSLDPHDTDAHGTLLGLAEVIVTLREKRQAGEAPQLTCRWLRNRLDGLQEGAEALQDDGARDFVLGTMKQLRAPCGRSQEGRVAPSDYERH